MMIEMNKDEATMIIKLAQKIITALEEELKNKHNKQIRESEDSVDSTEGYVNGSGSYE
tara:strand:- start:18244 stop:18417 length:174 start_codon:yes stop_codon:yes gene_type:complete